MNVATGDVKSLVTFPLLAYYDPATSTNKTDISVVEVEITSSIPLNDIYGLGLSFPSSKIIS